MLLFLFRLGSRRQVGELLRTGPAAAKYQALFGVDCFPHGDTLDALYTRLAPAEVQEVVCSLVERLIRGKALDSFRLLGRWFVVAVDATGVLVFDKRHCDHCLTQTSHGKTIYYHPVLEAKLVCRNGLVISLMTEFVENPGKNPTKQDCELKAFYRLADRIKKRFPRLPLLFTFDSLYACGPVFDLCRRHDWRFFAVLKEGSIPSVHEEFLALSRLQPENRLTLRTGKNAEINQEYRWVEQIDYQDSEKREHRLNVLQCRETKPHPEKGQHTTNFQWVTDCPLDRNKVVELAQNGGRDRWKIENEGFNVQKNGGYALEHAYSQNEKSAKVFYYLLQIAHLLAQLLAKTDLLRKLTGGVKGPLKNLAFFLLEAWRNAIVDYARLQEIMERKIQIRFDSS